MQWLFIGVVAFVVWLYLRGQAAGASSLPYSTNANAQPDIAVAPDTSGAGLSSIDQFAEAIYQMEGDRPGDLAYDNDNPGNLRSAPGQTGSARGFAVFPDFATGDGALQSYIRNHVTAHPDWDFYDFFQNYLGQRVGGPTVTPQGNSDAYAEFVAGQLGADPATPLSALLAGVS